MTIETMSNTKHTTTTTHVGVSSRVFDTFYPTHIYTNNKKNKNAELIKSFKTHLNKNISKGLKVRIHLVK